MYEKAVAYFERAAQIQPQEVKWKLMVASCHRRSGDYQLAFEIYRLIHADFPDNVECLRYLVHICDDLGKKDQVRVRVRLRVRVRVRANPNPNPNPNLSLRASVRADGHPAEAAAEGQEEHGGRGREHAAAVRPAGQEPPAAALSLRHRARAAHRRAELVAAAAAPRGAGHNPNAQP